MEQPGVFSLVDDYNDRAKAVCDKLAGVDHEVQEVDLKLELGYRGAKGHKDWRRVREVLVKAGNVTVTEVRL